MEDNKEISFGEALGVSDEWMEELQMRINSDDQSTKTISELALKEADFIKKDVFGEVPAEFSEYERKLLVGGILIGMKVSSDRVGSHIGIVNLGSMTGNLSDLPSIIRKMMEEQFGKDMEDDES